MLQVHLSYAADETTALAIAHEQWRTNVFQEPVSWDLDTPDAFDEASKHVAPEDMRGSVLVSSSPAQHTDWLAERAALGFDELYLHHVGTEQHEFIDVFGEKVLPQLR